MKTLYRIENESGRGVYSCRKVYRYLEEKKVDLLSTSPKSPTAANDKELVKNCKAVGIDVDSLLWTGSYRFGFNSIEKMFEWFSPEILKGLVKECGVVIWIFEGVHDEDQIDGDSQSIINYNAYATTDRRPMTVEEIDLYIAVLS